MRLVHIIDSLSRGGAERQLLLLHEGLRKAGHESIVGYLGPPAPLKDDFPSVPDLHDLGVGGGLRKGPAAAAAVRRFIQKMRPDVVHSSLMYSDYAVAAAVLPGVPKVATLCNVLDIDVRHTADPRARPWRMWVANQLWSVALRSSYQQVIAISDAVKASGIRSLRLPPDMISIVGRAYTHSGNRPSTAQVAERQGGASADPPLIINVGRLVPQKGQATLVRALARPQVRDYPWRCEIIGDGPQRKQLAALIDTLGLQERVILMGPIPNAVQRVASADLFVFPSQYEGLGVSAVEAASLGVPSILSAIPALSEIMGEPQNGWLVPPNDDGALAAAIASALGDPTDARRRGARLAQRAQAKYSPNAMVDATVRVYEAALHA